MISVGGSMYPYGMVVWLVPLVFGISTDIVAFIRPKNGSNSSWMPIGWKATVTGATVTAAVAVAPVPLPPRMGRSGCETKPLPGFVSVMEPTTPSTTARCPLHRRRSCHRPRA